ncbi:hypothetical protein L228DRAFT_258266 [Xylona heveae TC161]|uniref:Uncharacterized protein n=1 Tax=Xylona heveae (strain CBS 132557 / TC161) TaxID=1328760 RepID=A0A165K2J5_XYLHT|nr:hypothetical protein L228DRAFT_258266 [Xylona heveae TC161]KZF26911.1 hypothetical protein L228DRAFT_258266 [Xylona heveae TC161]
MSSFLRSLPARASAANTPTIALQSSSIAIRTTFAAHGAVSRQAGNVLVLRGSRRQASSSSKTSASQEPSAHANFYKQFSRPIAKVFLPAVFTYQALYWLWVKLEKDEVKAEKEANLLFLVDVAEISALENKLREVTAEKKPSS